MKAILRKYIVNCFRNLTRSSQQRNNQLVQGISYFEKYSKHRMILPVYDLTLYNGQCWIAPNATIVGEVLIGEYVSIWHNVVVRGDINRVAIFDFTTIGDGTVIHTANSLPTGLPAGVSIGSHCTIQNNCSLYSCHMENDTFIGANSVIMEGSRIERGAIILPNSVVPPGRLIPARQIWAGNPVEFVRDITESEAFANYNNTLYQWQLSETYLNEFTPYPYNYLLKESTREEVDIDESRLSKNLNFNEPIKYYV